MGALNPFAENNGRPAPDAREVSNAEANANRITVIGPDGTRNQEYGYISPNTGNFINQAPTKNSNVQAAMRLNESPAERQARELREGIGQSMLQRGSQISDTLGSAPLSLTEGLGALPQASSQNIRQNVAGMPSSQMTDPMDVRNAVYEDAMSMMRPDMELSDRRARSALADRGLPMDGQAYQGEMDRLDRGNAASLSQIARMAIQQGADQQQRNFGNQLSLRGAGVNENLAQAGMDQQQFGNQLTLRGTQLGERELEQNNQLNQIAALLGGSPQFNRQTLAPSPIDVGGNMYASYSANEQARQAGMANQQAGLGSMFSLGGTLGGAYLGGRR